MLCGRLRGVAGGAIRIMSRSHESGEGGERTARMAWERRSRLVAGRFWREMPTLAPAGVHCMRDPACRRTTDRNLLDLLSPAWRLGCLRGGWMYLVCIYVPYIPGQ